jgi:ABC-type phosphate transport system permease subunit
MEIFLTILAAVALIPTVLFVYGIFSELVQTIFNNNFNENEHKTKWRLNTPSAYVLLALTTLSFINMILICSAAFDVVLSFSIIAAAYCYLFSLIKYHYTELFKKLD